VLVTVKRLVGAQSSSRKTIHQVGNSGIFEIFRSVRFQVKGNLCPPSKGIATRVGVYFERSVLGRGTEDMLHGTGILLCFRRDGCNMNAIRDKEAAVKAKPKGPD
jgi:hypothetical protein